MTVLTTAAPCILLLITGFIKISELDTKSEECQRFFRDGLTTSFHKILNDEAVNGWKYDIHVSSIFLCIVARKVVSTKRGIQLKEYTE